MPTFAYIELPQEVRLPVAVREIRATGMWLETNEPLPLEFRANLRVIFPNAHGALGFSVEVICRGEKGLGIELSKNSDAITKQTLVAWSKGQHAEIPSSPPKEAWATSSAEETEDLPRFQERDPFAHNLSAISGGRARVEGAPRVPLKYQLEGTSVLVVDDDNGCARYLQNGLGRLGGKVTIAKDGALALEILRDRQKRVDAVLLDWMLPVMSGERVLAELRGLTPKVPVAIVSGVVQSGAMRARVRQLGADEVFAKPFELRQISDWLVRSVVVSR